MVLDNFYPHGIIRLVELYIFVNTLPDKQQQSSPINTIIAEHFKLTPTGLEVIGDPTFEHWLACGKYLYKTKESLSFIIGDWLGFGEMKWGETYRKAVETFGFEIQTLRNFKWVSNSVPPARRRPELSFTHHSRVAELDAEEQEQLLQEAAEKHLSDAAFRRLIAERQMQYPSATQKSAGVHPQPGQQPQKVSVRTDTSLFDKTVEVGNEFVKYLRKLSQETLTKDQQWGLSSLLDDISEVTASMHYDDDTASES